MTMRAFRARAFLTSSQVVFRFRSGTALLYIINPWTGLETNRLGIAIEARWMYHVLKLQFCHTLK